MPEIPPIQSEEEAEALRAALSRYYREPVHPLSTFCEAIRTWFRCIERRNTDPDLSGGWGQGEEYHHLLRQIETDIEKSNLLARLLYAGEPLRTRMCPEHKGRWNGNAMLTGCSHHCDGTGWLPEDESFSRVEEK